VCVNVLECGVGGGMCFWCVCVCVLVRERECVCVVAQIL